MVVSSDAPQTRTVPDGRSERRAQGAHGYFPANIAKNAGTVPGYSVKMKGSLVNTVTYYKPNRDHLSKRQKIEALGSARA